MLMVTFCCCFLEIPYYGCDLDLIMFDLPGKVSSRMKNGRDFTAAAQEMRFTTYASGKASSSENTRGKVLHMPRFTLIESKFKLEFFWGINF